MNVQNLLTLVASVALVACASAEITIDWVFVGNANNAVDPIGMNDEITRYGSVVHDYRIGKYEVTNAQCGEFLNAKGQTNTNGIYDSGMSNLGIIQSGSDGSYSFTVDSALANRPVAFVSWFDAARFSNWMSNGNGSGDMEDGAYTLNGATSGIVTKNVGASVYLPSENEWYKAAYYNPANASYSLYPNGKNTITTLDANYSSSVG